MNRTTLLNLVAIVLIILLVGVFASFTISGVAQDDTATPTVDIPTVETATETGTFDGTETPSEIITETPTETASPTLTETATSTPPETTFTVINNSGHDLCLIDIGGNFEAANDGYMFMHPTAHGQQETFVVPSGTYDVYVDTCDGWFTEPITMLIEGNMEWIVTPADLIYATPFPTYVPTITPIIAPLNQPFTVSYYQPALIGDTGNKMMVVDIIDSRCPSDVQCTEAGSVEVIVTFWSDTEIPTRSSFIQRSSNHQVSMTRGGMYFTLISVEPYPLSTGMLEKSAYLIVFSIKPIQP